MAEEKQVDGRNTQSMFVMIKLRVVRKPELEDDYQLFRMHWQREIRKTLTPLGEIKYLTIVT